MSDSPLTKMTMEFMRQSMLIDRLNALGLEYHDKAITPERFASRVYEELYRFQHPKETA